MARRSKGLASFVTVRFGRLGMAGRSGAGLFMVGLSGLRVVGHRWVPAGKGMAVATRRSRVWVCLGSADQGMARLGRHGLDCQDLVRRGEVSRGRLDFYFWRTS